MSKITINDIADIAGVSKSTVSRALNNSGYVNEEVRMKILQIAKDNSYKFSASTVNFSKGGQAMIGVVFPSLKSPFFSNIVEGISRVADENECGIVVCSTNDNPEKELRSIKMLQGRKIKGLIITPTAVYQGVEGWNALQAELNTLNIPVVLVDRNMKKSNWDSITFDNYNGAYMLGEMVVAEGYKKIGAIIADTCLQLGMDRLNGFKQALEVNGLKLDAQCLYVDERIISREMAYDYTVQKIQNNLLPDAIFLSNTLIAEGFFKALFAAGLKPGRDIRCLGFDHIDVLDIIDFEYTYLEREMVETGMMAMQMLLDRFQQHIESRREFITPARIICR